MILVPQPPILHLVGPVFLVPMDIAIGHISHIIVPREGSDVGEGVHLRHEIITFWVQVVSPDDLFSQGQHLLPAGGHRSILLHSDAVIHVNARLHLVLPGDVGIFRVLLFKDNLMGTNAHLLTVKRLP